MHMKRKSWISRRPWLGVAALLREWRAPRQKHKPSIRRRNRPSFPFRPRPPLRRVPPSIAKRRLKSELPNSKRNCGPNVSQLQRTPSVQAQEVGFHTAAPSASPAPAKPGEPYQVGSDLKMSANWKDGLNIESANKDFRVHVGGRTQLDWSGFTDGATAVMAARGWTKRGQLPPSPLADRRHLLRDHGLVLGVGVF